MANNGDNASIRRLKRAVKPVDGGAPVQLRQGQVTAVDAPSGTCTVLLAGATTETAQVRYAGKPEVGDTVNIVKSGPYSLAVGKSVGSEGGVIQTYNSSTGVATVLLDSGETVTVQMVGGGSGGGVGSEIDLPAIADPGGTGMTGSRLFSLQTSAGAATGDLAVYNSSGSYKVKLGLPLTNAGSGSPYTWTVGGGPGTNTGGFQLQSNTGEYSGLSVQTGPPTASISVTDANGTTSIAVRSSGASGGSSIDLSVQGGSSLHIAPGALTVPGYIDVPLRGSDPPAPTSNYIRLYAKSGGIYIIDSTGTVSQL